MHILLRSFVAASLSACVAFAATYPAYDGYVTDAGGILDSTYHEYLEKLLTALDTRTTAQITVVTIPSLEGEDLASYNVELFKKWGVGRAGKDNGILFLIAVKDRRMRIEAGYGLEGALPDAQAKSLLHNIVRPLFKEAKMTEGITAGTEAIVDVVAKEYKITRKDLGVERPIQQAKDMIPNAVADTKNDTAKQSKSTPWLFIVIFIVIVVAIVIIARRSPGGTSSGGRPPRRADDDDSPKPEKPRTTFGGGKSGGGGANESW